MSTPGDTHNALSDVTNIQTSTLDEVTRRRDERNMQQRIRRAEMSDEQREEIRRKQRTTQSIMDQNTPIMLEMENIQPDAHEKENIPPDAYEDHSDNVPTRVNTQQRKRRAQMTDEQREQINKRQHEYQREYRARKKAALQNLSSPSVVTQIFPSSSHEESEELAEDTSWLHRNDNYFPRPRGPHIDLAGQIPTSGDATKVDSDHGMDGEEAALDITHGLHNENMYDDEIIQRHAQEGPSELSGVVSSILS